MSTNTSRNKVLVLIIVLLLITNLALLAFFVFGKKGKGGDRKRDGFTTELKKNVGFDDAQIAEVNKQKENNWSEAKKKMDQIRQIKTRIFEKSRQENAPDSSIKQLTDSIGMLQSQVEMDLYRHLKELRKICRPDQVAAFDSFFQKMVNRPRDGRGERQKGDGGPPPPKR